MDTTKPTSRDDDEPMTRWDVIVLIARDPEIRERDFKGVKDPDLLKVARELGYNVVDEY
jgi:hypothetical protein